MKHLISFALSIIFVFLFVTNAYAANSDKTQSGEKTVFKDAEWAYEQLSVYGYEIDEYIGNSENADVPYSFAKEYITAIGSYAFNGKNVKNVETTFKIESIGDYAFNNCLNLEKVVLFDSLKQLGVGVFYGDVALKSVNLDETSIDEIPSYCFAECGMKEITVPNSCYSIGEYAFFNCNSLHGITIPKNVAYIADTAFTNCDNLVIKCYLDSYAEQFAKENNIEFELLDPILGDANFDGSVDVRDVTAIQKYKAGLTKLTRTGIRAADVTGDEEVSVRDATQIQRYLANIITGF